GGLTQLSRWWIELGITPVRIQPGHPQQNGIHERMHRTLKDWIEFNHVRPHQSLGQKPPATVVKPYRPFSSRPKTVEYDSTMEVHLVTTNGFFHWKGARVFASEVLVGANIGLLPIDQTVWSIYFGSVRIGYLDGLTQRVQNRLPDRLKPPADQDPG
ncbi:MAG: hypothetical protein QOE82_847, partial [Thermoanaerobaculia bacterium]|nr:hypothetical protein [Thermoanaerobaculia bacterium]